MTKRCEDCKYHLVGADDTFCLHPDNLFRMTKYERLVTRGCGPDAKNFEPKEAAE